MTREIYLRVSLIHDTDGTVHTAYCTLKRYSMYIYMIRIICLGRSFSLYALRRMINDTIHTAASAAYSILYGTKRLTKNQRRSFHLFFFFFFFFPFFDFPLLVAAEIRPPPPHTSA